MAYLNRKMAQERRKMTAGGRNENKVKRNSIASEKIAAIENDLFAC